MKSGYVCVLSNPAMPKMVYLSYCFKRPEQLAWRLSQDTAIPSPFQVAWKIYVDDPRALFNSLSNCSKLRSSHIGRDRFYKLDVRTLAKAICCRLNEMQANGHVRRLPEPKGFESVGKYSMVGTLVVVSIFSVAFAYYLTHFLGR